MKKVVKDPVLACKTPSALIRLAVQDMSAVEKLPGYTIDMGTWHSYAAHTTKKCSVCFAGAVMAISCGMPRCIYRLSPTIHDMPGIPELVINRISALNSVRQGQVLWFVCNFYPYTPAGVALRKKAAAKVIELFESGMTEIVNSRCKTPATRKKFKKEMTDLADKLEAVGI